MMVLKNDGSKMMVLDRKLGRRTNGGGYELKPHAQLAWPAGVDPNAVVVGGTVAGFAVASATSAELLGTYNQSNTVCII